MPARKAEVMALIVQARVAGAKAEEIFRDILTETLTEDMKPIRREGLRLAWPPRFLGAGDRVRLGGDGLGVQDHVCIAPWHDNDR